MNRLALFLSGLIVAAVGGLLVIGLNWEVKDLPTETFKALLQLVVVGIAGQVVSILISKANDERQDLLLANQLRTSLLDRLNKSYVDVKRVRRVVRATAEKVVEGGTQKTYVEKSKFHDFLQTLNESQLDLELISKDVESNQSLFVDAEPLIANLDSMEEYLNTIVDEYEQSNVKTVERPTNCYDLKGFPRLSDLVGNYKTSTFRIQFVHTYYKSLESIRKAFAVRR